MRERVGANACGTLDFISSDRDGLIHRPVKKIRWKRRTSIALQFQAQLP